VHLVGFIIRNLSRCTVTWTSNAETRQTYCEHCTSQLLFADARGWGDRWLGFYSDKGNRMSLHVNYIWNVRLDYDWLTSQKIYRLISQLRGSWWVPPQLRLPQPAVTEQTYSFLISCIAYIM
jgi:hypothetical protein